METTTRSLPVGVRLIQNLSANTLPPKTKTNVNKIIILVFTFFIYTSYHLSRKPISIVKGVLHVNCTANKSCGNWPPFDGSNYQTLLGSLDYSFLFAYAVGMFITGHIAERMNLRTFLVIGMTLSGIFTALFGFGRYWQIHSLVYYIVIQIICGLVQSSGWPPVVACVANWFGKGKRGLVFGVWNSHTSIGNIVGSLVAGAFVDYNWGLSFIIPAIIIVVMAILVLLFLIPHPHDIGCEIEESQPTAIQRLDNASLSGDESEIQHLLSRPPQLDDDEVHVEPTEPLEAISFLRALRIPGVIEYSLCLFFAKLVSYTFLFWLPSYILHTAHFSAEISAEFSTLFDVGGIAGAIAAGVVSDMLGGRAFTCFVMLLIGAPSLFVYQAFGNTSKVISIVLLLFCGALVNGPYALITTAVSADLGTHPSLQGNAKALATVSAIIDGTGSMGAALGPLLTGLISPYGWQNVFYMLISADLLAMLFLVRLVLKEIVLWRTSRRT